MGDYKPRSTPYEMDINKIIDNNDELIDKLLREIIGSLIYIMIATIPDIYYTVTRLSQDLVKPTTILLTRAKHVLRYLKGTINQSLVFKNHRST